MLFLWRFIVFDLGKFCPRGQDVHLVHHWQGASVGSNCVDNAKSQVRCAEVARTLADLEASEECIAAALLHSVLDSSMLTEEKLRMSMCAEVADTVCNVHKLSGICQVFSQSYVPQHLSF